MKSPREPQSRRKSLTAAGNELATNNKGPKGAQIIDFKG